MKCQVLKYLLSDQYYIHHVHHLFKVEVHHVTSNNVNVNTHATIKLLNQLPNYWLLYWISGTGL